MLSSRACLWILLASCTGSHDPWLTADQREIFAVLDDFDSLDTMRLPFVRVSTESEDRRTDRYGFSLRTDGRSLHVRYLDLCRDVVDLRPMEEPGKPRIWFEPVDLRDHVRVVVAAARKHAVAPYGIDYYCRPETPMPPEPELLLLARACARRGLQEEVAALWDVLPEGSRTLAGLREGDLRLSLSRGLEERLVLDFADPEISWRELLRRHDAWLRHFPGEIGSESVTEQRNALAALVDAGREKRLSAGSTTAELVSALRTASHHELDSSWQCPSVPPPGEGPPTDAHPEVRLERLGFEAVPALIAALPDRSPTRRVLYSSRHGGGFFVRTLGDLAQAVLERIAGYCPDAEDRVAGWVDWHERARTHGIRRVLLDEARHMDTVAMKSLLRRWPEDLPLVLESLRAAAPTGGSLHGQALCELTRVEGIAADPRLPDLFREVLRDARDIRLRLDAACLLRDHDPTTAVAAIVAEWRKLLAKPDPDTVDLEMVAELLVRVGAEQAWLALSKGTALPAGRAALLDLLVRKDWRAALDASSPATHPLAESVLRTYLLSLLRDPATLGGTWTVGSSDGRVTRLATRRDLAAWVFTTTWPVEFPTQPLRPKDVVLPRHRR